MNIYIWVLTVSLSMNPTKPGHRITRYHTTWRTSVDVKTITGWWLTYPSEKYESQLGWWHSQYMEKWNMFQTTNQICWHICSSKFTKIIQKKNNLVGVALASRSIHANCYRNVLYRPPATGFGPEVGNCCCTCLFCIHVFRVPIPAMTAISCVWKHAQNTTFIIIQPLSEGSAVFLLCFSRDPSKSKFFDSIDQTGGRGHRMQLEWSGQQCRA